MKHINLGASKASVNDKFLIAELTVSSVDHVIRDRLCSLSLIMSSEIGYVNTIDGDG